MKKLIEGMERANGKRILNIVTGSRMDKTLKGELDYTSLSRLGFKVEFELYRMHDMEDPNLRVDYPLKGFDRNFIAAFKKYVPDLSQGPDFEMSAGSPSNEGSLVALYGNDANGYALVVMRWDMAAAETMGYLAMLRPNWHDTEFGEE